MPLGVWSVAICSRRWSRPRLATRRSARSGTAVIRTSGHRASASIAHTRSRSHRGPNSPAATESAAFCMPAPGFSRFSFGPIYQATAPGRGEPQWPCGGSHADPDLFQLGLPHFRAACDQLRVFEANPLIPAVLAFIETAVAAYIITEYLPGPSLYEVLDGRRRLDFPLREVVEWGKNLCDLLEQMHSQRPPFLKRHRGEWDLLLDSQRTVKVINLGLARDRLLYWRPLVVRTY